MLLSQCTLVALAMIKVLCASQADDSLTGNLCRHHFLFEKVPENFKHVIKKTNMIAKKTSEKEILRENPTNFLENIPCM